METEHTGLMIIRAWVEQGSSERLRAHIRLTTDVSTGFERTLTVARSDDVCAAVQEWLTDLLNGPSDELRPDRSTQRRET